LLGVTLVAIDIEKFLTEITPDQVCGDDLEYDAEFIALEQEVQGKAEQSMGDSVIEAEPPNWREVKKQAEQLLARTRDLRVCMYYLRALTEIDGLLGLADGMALLKATTEKFWDDLHPQLDPDDDNDPTERVNVLISLCDFSTFLHPLQKVPLVESKGLGRFNLRDIQLANGSVILSEKEQKAEMELPQMAAVDGAFQECDSETVLATATAARNIQDNLNQLEAFVTDKVGTNNAASFTELRVLLKDINSIVADQVERLGMDDVDNVDMEDTAEESDGDPSSKKPAKTSGSAGINSSQDVIKALNLISEYYKKNEPSSPIPMMLERVTGLVGKSFFEVLQDIAPNGVEQVEFLRGVAHSDSSE